MRETTGGANHAWRPEGFTARRRRGIHGGARRDCAATAGDGRVTDRTGIEVAQAGVTRDGVRIFDGLSLSLHERRIGVVGRNGSGKSTLLRLIAGLQPVQSGSVRVDGVDVARDRAAAIRRVGILFQNPDHQIIFPTVEEELAFGLRQLGLGGDAAGAQARAILAEHGVADWAPRRTHELSHGQRHLLCLLSVLIMAPGVILLDEPFTGLDIPTTMRLRARLDGLTQRLVVSTHDPALLDGFDRVIWLEDGRVVDDGPAAPLLERFTARMRQMGRDGTCLR